MKKRRDKRFTVRQVMNEIHQAYDFFEEATKETLHKEFGFGEKRWSRFVEAFSEAAANKCIEIENDLRRRSKKL